MSFPTMLARPGAAVAVALCAAFLAVPSGAQTAGSHAAMSKQDMKALVAAAKTPEDHRKLAAHYREEAARLKAEAKDHAEMAVLYAKNPDPRAAKNPYAYKTQAHCSYVSKRYEEAARRTEALAAVHEEMAAKASP